MAKSLGIRTPAGFDNPESVEKSVLEPVTPTGNLGSIVANILEASADPMLVTVDLAARVVHGMLAGPRDASDLVGGTLASLEAELKQLEAGRSAVWINAENSAPDTTVTEGAAIPLELVASMPVRPSRSISSLVSAIEDAAALGAAGPLGTDDAAFVVVDQALAKVSLLFATAGHVAAVRALFNDGGIMEDTVRFEQIPAEEASDASATAFE